MELSSLWSQIDCVSYVTHAWHDSRNTRPAGKVCRVKFSHRQPPEDLTISHTKYWALWAGICTTEAIEIKGTARRALRQLPKLIMVYAMVYGRNTIGSADSAIHSTCEVMAESADPIVYLLSL